MLDNFSAAVRTVGRSPADTINKNSLRKVLTSQVRLLASYVTVACKGSLANLILSGFPPQKGKASPWAYRPSRKDWLSNMANILGS